MSSNKEYFAIFAGGGVRGTAYIGALKALEELKIGLNGYASSSVGAVFASLLAVGYSYGELKELILNVDYQQFRDLYLPLPGKDFGVFKGDSVYFWLKENIEKKFYENQNYSEIKPVTFKDLNTDLIIIATDISYTNFKEYSRVKTPDTEIAHAVRTSISIPGFFKPVWENNSCLVDGDVINNFPIWKETSEIISNTNLNILEFRLEATEKPREITGILDYLSALIDTNYNIATDILEAQYGKNDQFDIVRIDTGKTKMIDFNISNDEKEILINQGYDSVNKYFNYDRMIKKQNIAKIYEKMTTKLKTLKNLVQKNKSKDALSKVGKLSIYFAENKDFIHKKIYNDFLEIQKLILKNAHTINYIGLDIMRERKIINSKIDVLINLLLEHSA